MTTRKFKFLRTGLKSDYDGFQWELCKWYKTERRELCHGFNCSENILDALKYVRGEILAEVEAKGKHFTGNDKSTWPQMRIVRAWKWQKKDSVALAIFSAELVIGIYEKQYPNDLRPHMAIESAKSWLNNPRAAAAWAAAWAARAAAWAAAGAACEAARAEAGAACEAAWAAAWAARAAAWAAAGAASEAARAAAWAARAAAWAAASEAATLDKINEWLLNHLDTLEILD